MKKEFLKNQSRNNLYRNTKTNLWNNELKNILIVGAGFAGSVIARQLAETRQYAIDIIDQRNHIGGNAYDSIHAETGARYHNYGPHIFHTNDSRIYDYLSKFTNWIPYKHKVEATVEGIGDLPLPVNLTSINKLFENNFSSEKEAVDFLEKIRVPISNPQNAYEYLINIYGEKITELFFSRYTRKMWDLDLKDLPSSIVARIPIRTNNDPYYFNDTYQCLPEKGYTYLFSQILDHVNIKIHLSVSFKKSMEKDYFHVFNSMPIDMYFDYDFGDLPYRSIKFEHRVNEIFNHRVPTINFTDLKKYTRKTNWDLYPGCGNGHSRLITYEIPCDYKDNQLERYYPVKTADQLPQKTYRKYKALSDKLESITFIGRCGQYIYYDMHQVVANSLKISNEFIGANRNSQ